MRCVLNFRRCLKYFRLGVLGMVFMPKMAMLRESIHLNGLRTKRQLIRELCFRRPCRLSLNISCCSWLPCGIEKRFSRRLGRVVWIPARYPRYWWTTPSHHEVAVPVASCVRRGKCSCGSVVVCRRTNLHFASDGNVRRRLCGAARDDSCRRLGDAACGFVCAV